MDIISRRSKVFVGIAALGVLSILFIDVEVVLSKLQLANGSKQVVERQNSTIRVIRNGTVPSKVGDALNVTSPSAPDPHAYAPSVSVLRRNSTIQTRPVVSPSVSNVPDSSIPMEISSKLPFDSGKPLKFYVLHVPQLTSYLVGNFTEIAMRFYQTALNEERAEIWLDRGLRRLSLDDGRTDDPSEADVIFVPAYLHLHTYILAAVHESERSGTPPSKGEVASYLLSRIIDKTKPHVLLVPTWNPGVSRKIGVAGVMKTFQGNGVNTWSVGFERNTFWQRVSVDRIIPVPYVVDPELSREELSNAMSTQRIPNFVFYVGDARRLAITWGGCNRTMIEPLTNRTDMLVRLVSKTQRVTQEEYNRNLFRSDYCLIICGDTPTTRSLASTMLHGCIPIRVGSRLRGLCEPPCHSGWGWTIAQLPHLPYGERIDWNAFPEVNEAEFAQDPSAVLDAMMNATSPEKKAMWRATMRETQLGWVYGWGSPVDSEIFGEAANYVWSSVKHVLAPHMATRR